MNGFTLVFSGDLRTYGHNPLTKETPYGVPYAAGVGDAFEEAEKMRDLLREVLDSRAPDYVEASHPGWYERLSKIAL